MKSSRTWVGRARVVIRDLQGRETRRIGAGEVELTEKAGGLRLLDRPSPTLVGQRRRGWGRIRIGYWRRAVPETLIPAAVEAKLGRGLVQFVAREIIFLRRR